AQHRAQRTGGRRRALFIRSSQPQELCSRLVYLVDGRFCQRSGGRPAASHLVPQTISGIITATATGGNRASGPGDRRQPAALFGCLKWAITKLSIRFSSPAAVYLGGVSIFSTRRDHGCGDHLDDRHSWNEK